jgi:hypothetical protein
METGRFVRFASPVILLTCQGFIGRGADGTFGTRFSAVVIETEGLLRRFRQARCG